MEDAWLKCEREFFVEENWASLGIDQKKLNNALGLYNKSLEKHLFGESPYVAEDLKWTMFQYREKEVNTTKNDTGK